MDGSTVHCADVGNESPSPLANAVWPVRQQRRAVLVAPTDTYQDVLVQRKIWHDDDDAGNSCLTRLRWTADMRLHEVLAQRITGMTLDARRQGRGCLIDTSGRAPLPGCGAAYGERSASPSPCPGADYRSYDEGFAGLTRLIHVCLTERSIPVFCCSCPGLSLWGSASRCMHPLDLRAMFPLILPFFPASTWRLRSSFFHAFPKSLPSPSPLLSSP